jgi:hypothetical protein
VDSIKVRGRHPKTLVKVSQAPAIGAILAQIVAQCTYKVRDLQLPDFAAGPGVILKQVELRSRPANALCKRAIFISRCDNIEEDMLDSIGFLDQYDQSPTSTFSFSLGFHFDPFAPAIAHAVAWETPTTNIMFSCWVSDAFDEVLENILIHAQTIDIVTFHGYERFSYKYTGSCIFNRVEESNVKGISFSKSNPRAVFEIVQALRRCLVSLPDVAFTRCPMPSWAFLRVAAAMSNVTCLSELISLSLTTSVAETFNVQEFLTALLHFSRLERLRLKGIPIDGSEAMAAVCGLSALHLLHLEDLSFVAPFSRPLQSGLVLLDISRGEFSVDALRSLFVAVMRDGVNHVPRV